MKKRLALLFVMFLSAGFAMAQSVSIDGSDSRVRYVGRTIVNGGDVTFDWSGTYLELNFLGDGISVHCGDNKHSYYNVFVDGEQLDNVVVTSSDTTIMLANGLGRGSHTLVLQKRTEGNEGCTTIKGFTAVGRSAKFLDAPLVRERHIEFIGDSFTCGYGVEAPATAIFSPETENCNLAHGAILSRMFDADYTFIANSGQGVVRNYGDKKSTSSTGTMRKLVKRTLNTDESKMWDFKASTYTPDMVVIFLGINDFSTEPSPSVKQFKNGYRELIDFLREVYGKDMPILSIATTTSPKLIEAVELLSKELNDKNYHYLTHSQVGLRTPADYGADGHPNYVGQRKVAMLTAPYISTLMNWDMPFVVE